MRVISKKRLQEFWEQHAAAERPLRAWWSLVKARAIDWTCWADVKQTFGAGVDKIGDCYVFDIGGNKFRLVAKISYRCKLVFIRKVMTHHNYDRQAAWQTECGCHPPPPNRPMTGRRKGTST